MSVPELSAEPAGAISFEDGNILLRSGREPESLLLRNIARGRFSHAGICNRGELREVVDAMPRGGQASAVAKSMIENFFDEEHAADGGGVYRYNGPSAKARAAARHAEDQCKEHFVFSIHDPILGLDLEPIDNNRLYCSEFVWRCYRDGANVVLVAPQDFVNLLAPENLNNTLKELGNHFARQRFGSVAELIPSAVSAAFARSQLKAFDHNGCFITPDQLADSTRVSLVREIPPAPSPKRGKLAPNHSTLGGTDDTHPV
jgi:hypothetical protein